MKSGDFVLLQMGQNDGGTLDTGRARGSLPGLGEDTKEVTMPDGKPELVHTYGWYMRKYIEDTKAKGATIIVMSLTAKNIFRDGKNVRVYDNFSRWAAEVAQSAGVAFLDHIDIVANEYDKLGQEKVRGLFTDSTHTTAVGADMNASFVVAGLKTLNSPLVKYLRPRGKLFRPTIRPSRHLRAISTDWSLHMRLFASSVRAEGEDDSVDTVHRTGQRVGASDVTADHLRFWGKPTALPGVRTRARTVWP